MLIGLGLGCLLVPSANTPSGVRVDVAMYAGEGPFEHWIEFFFVDQEGPLDVTAIDNISAFEVLCAPEWIAAVRLVDFSYGGFVLAFDTVVAPTEYRVEADPGITFTRPHSFLVPDYGAIN